MNKENRREMQLREFSRLLDIMDRLREECPWDKKQTNQSLRANTIEETFELCDAIIDENDSEIKKELGDLLLHIVFYSKIGSESGAFDIADVCSSICDKLIYRHPHVFGDAETETAAGVEKSWEELKLKEKGGNKTVLAGVPKTLPALIKAYRIQDKARNVGFDWEKKEDVWAKVKEELCEFEQEIKDCNQDKMEREFGDLLFAMINAARLYKINPENALELTNRKFINRFNFVEAQLKAINKSFKESSLAEMDILWDKAKEQGL